MKLKHIKLLFKNILLFSFLFTLTVPAYSELSVEEIIKGRKAIFSKNYNTAKRVQSLASNGDFDDAKELMKEMSENYKSLLKYFPENTKEGFKTESLPFGCAASIGIAHGGGAGKYMAQWIWILEINMMEFEPRRYMVGK